MDIQYITTKHNINHILNFVIMFHLEYPCLETNCAYKKFKIGLKYIECIDLSLIKNQIFL